MLVATAKVALAAPSGTRTLGREAARLVFELESDTKIPPPGARPLSMTVPVAVPPLPPAIVDGLSTTEATVGPVWPSARLQAYTNTKQGIVH